MPTKIRPSQIISSHEIKIALCNVKLHLRSTPLVRSRFMSKLTGAEVYLKLECLQPTNSFKVRGAINALSQLDEASLSRGVVTASGGNHGLAIAYAGKILKAGATIFLPENTPAIKVEAIRDLGAEIVMTGAAWDEANKEAIEFTAAHEMTYIHPFDNQQVMAGQGTIVPEIIEQQINPDLIVASIGGGGLTSGIASATRHYLPKTKVKGVETVGADCMNQSIKANRLVELPSISSIADSLGAKRSAEKQFNIIKERVNQLALVEDRETVEDILSSLSHDKLLLEPAAACCLSALRLKRLSFEPGSTIVVIACGGNISLNQLLDWKDRFVL
ncbi:MAG: threonine/serine dehydratase [Candidatus Obscuribacterales bacterium]|nr:threonine/serine dehydratase [Candidatus Obscuribacterales bacterium]